MRPELHQNLVQNHISLIIIFVFYKLKWKEEKKNYDSNTHIDFIYLIDCLILWIMNG